MDNTTPKRTKNPAAVSLGRRGGMACTPAQNAARAAALAPINARRKLAKEQRTRLAAYEAAQERTRAPK